MYYVYILTNLHGRTYVGFTTNIEKRLGEHNSGLSHYTKRSSGEWSLTWFCCFKDKNKALSFEKYLKSGSGIAFMRKRFL